MYHHMTTVNTACAPAVRHRLILIDWVQRTEDMLWAQELPLAIDDCGRQRIGFLLLNRLEAVAGAALDRLLHAHGRHAAPAARLGLHPHALLGRVRPPRPGRRALSSKTGKVNSWRAAYRTEITVARGNGSHRNTHIRPKRFCPVVLSVMPFGVLPSG